MFCKPEARDLEDIPHINRSVNSALKHGLESLTRPPAGVARLWEYSMHLMSASQASLARVFNEHLTMEAHAARHPTSTKNSKLSAEVVSLTYGHWQKNSSGTSLRYMSHASSCHCYCLDTLTPPRSPPAGRTRLGSHKEGLGP